MHDDEGKPLEVKEGVVLDRNGRAIRTPDAHDESSASARISFGNNRVFVWKAGPVVSALAILLFPVLLIAGFTVLGAVVAGLIALWIGFSVIRSVLSLLGMGQRRN